MNTFHQITVREFGPAYERTTAAIEIALPTGERYQEALHIGVVPQDEHPDVFMEHEGSRIQISVEAIPVLVKQLKRAAAIAKELQ